MIKCYLQYLMFTFSLVPEINLDREYAMAYFGETVTIKCFSRDNKVNWIKNGDVIPDDKLQKNVVDENLMEKVLTLYNVQDRDSGTYICKQTTKKKPQSDRFELYVGSKL